MNLFGLIFSIFKEKRKSGFQDVEAEINKIALDKTSILYNEFLKNKITDYSKISYFINYISIYFANVEEYSKDKNEYIYPVNAMILDSDQEQQVGLKILIERYEDLEVVATVCRFDDAIKVINEKNIGLILVNGERDVNIIYDFVSMINVTRVINIPVLWFEGAYLFIIINDQMYRIIYS